MRLVGLPFNLLSVGFKGPLFFDIARLDFLIPVPVVLVGAVDRGTLPPRFDVPVGVPALGVWVPPGPREDCRRLDAVRFAPALILRRLLSATEIVPTDDSRWLLCTV